MDLQSQIELQTKWEAILSAEGLSMNRGLSHLVYGCRYYEATKPFTYSLIDKLITTKTIEEKFIAAEWARTYRRTHAATVRATKQRYLTSSGYQRRPKETPSCNTVSGPSQPTSPHA